LLNTSRSIRFRFQISVSSLRFRFASCPDSSLTIPLSAFGLCMLRQSAHSLQRIKGIYYLSTTPRRPQSAMAYPTNPSNPTDLLSALPERFEQARQSGQLFFFPSQAKDVYSGGKRVCLASYPIII
jgi:hypothetical protein